MKRFAEQLNKKSQTVKMTAAERRELKTRLVSYMEYHPLPKTVAQKNAESYIKSEKFISIDFSNLHVRGFSVMFAAFVLVFVPIFAERSVPGDVLYPVKVNFNEEIRSSLSVSPYAKVEWETERLERRISEARLLASEGKLTPEVEEAVAKAVGEHSDAAEASIALIRESDSDEAAIAEIAFESALSVQAEVLEGALAREVTTADTSEGEGRSVAMIASMVAEKQKEAVEKHSGAVPSYEKLMAKIERETTRAYELFTTVRESASEEEVFDIERRLADIERSVAEAMEMYATEQASSTDLASPAIVLLRTELSDTTKLISFMTDIDVRENVTVEALVPVTLTDDELTAIITAKHQEIDVRLTALLNSIAETEAISEKIAAGIEYAQSQFNGSKDALTLGDLKTAQAIADETLLAIADLEVQIGATGSGEVTDDPIDTEIPVGEEDKGTTTEEVIDEDLVQ